MKQVPSLSVRGGFATCYVCVLGRTVGCIEGDISALPQACEGVFRLFVFFYSFAFRTHFSPFIVRQGC